MPDIAEIEVADVLIVGLGPVGAAAANLLGKAGHKVLVIDQTDGAGLRPRAGGLDDENLRLLQRIDLIDEFLQTSRPLPVPQMVSSYMEANEDGPSLYDPNHPEPVLLLNGMQAPEGVGRPGAWPPEPEVFWPGRNGYPLGARGFYQPKFEEVLRKGLERFPSVTIRVSTQCVDLTQTATHVTARLQNVQGSWTHTPGNEVGFSSVPVEEVYSVSCKYVIGCDGARSTVRKAMGGRGMVSMDYDQRWWACDVKLTQPEEKLWGTKLPNFSQLIADPRRAYTVVPLWQVTDRPPQGRHVRFDIQVSENDKEEDLQSPEKIRSLISTWLDAGDYELVRFAVYRFWSLLADSWRCKRIFLAGDACHTMPPFLGQGMNQGLKDVTNLCWKVSAVLRGFADPESLLETYEEERKPVVRAVVQGSLEVGRMFEAMRAASLKGREALEREVANGRGRGLEGILKLSSSKITQRTDSTKAYPRLVNANGKDPFTGKTFPQLRVASTILIQEPAKESANTDTANHPPEAQSFVLFDYAIKHNSPCEPGFVLVAVSEHGTAPVLSDTWAHFLTDIRGTTVQLALSEESDASARAVGCVYRVAPGEPSDEFEQASPFAVLLRPDHFVLGCTHLANAESLLVELKGFLLGEQSSSRL